MKLQRISFIEAGAPGFHVFSKYSVARVGTVLLSTILRERGYEVRAFIEDIAPLDWIFIESSDLVCISTLTSTAPRAYKIAERVRAKGIPVVMGGVHPTFLPEEALQYADFVVRGEGEYALGDLVTFFERGAPARESIRGLSYMNAQGDAVHNPPREHLSERQLNSLPIPNFSLVHKWKSSVIYPISTSRGCPFDCKFCSVISMFGRKYRFKSIGVSLREVRHAHAVSRATKFFVDDNFTAHKGRAKALLREMITERLTSDWSAQVRTDVAKDKELLALMADAGCHTLYIGFESINPRTLDHYNKRQALDDIVHCIRAVKDHGIHIHGMFVVGADTDDPSVIRRTTEFAIKNHIDTMQIMILTPLPGTPFFDEMQQQGRLLHTDWSKYNAHHVVFRPAQIPPKTLQTESFKEMRRFYSWKYILRHTATLDLHYAAIGLAGKRIIHKALKEVSEYLDSLHMDAPGKAC